MTTCALSTRIKQAWLARGLKENRDYRLYPSGQGLCVQFSTEATERLTAAGSSAGAVDLITNGLEVEAGNVFLTLQVDLKEGGK